MFLHNLNSETDDGREKSGLPPYEEIHRTYFNYICKVCRNAIVKVSGEEELIHDAVQEACLRISRSLDSVKNPERLRFFIGRTARNPAFNILRKKRRIAENESSMSDEDLANIDSGNIYRLIESNPEKLMLKKEINEALALALDTIKDLYSEPLIYHYFHDRDPKEIAKILGVSVDTVYTRLRRGKALLRKELEMLLKEGESNG